MTTRLAPLVRAPVRLAAATLALIAAALAPQPGCALVTGVYPCDADENCPSGTTCAAGRCVAGAPTGDAGATGGGEGEGEDEGGPDGGDAGAIGDGGAAPDGGGPADGGAANDGGLGAGDGGGVDGGIGVDGGGGPQECFGDPQICGPIDRVRYVCQQQTATCSPAVDPTSIAAAAADAPDDGLPFYVFVHDGAYLESSFDVGAGEHVVIVGQGGGGGGGAIVDVTVSGDPGVRVRQGGRLALHDVDLASFSGGDALISVEDEGSHLLVEDAEISDSFRVGVVSEAGTTVALHRARVVGNTDGGLDLQGAATITSTIIAGNGTNGPGPNGTDFGGVRVTAAAGLVRIVHATIADNQARDAAIAGAQCASATAVLNSIVYDNVGAVGAVSAPCAVADSIVEDGADPSAGVVDVDPALDGQWRIAAGSPAVDLGDPAHALGVPLDIDGEARSQGQAPDLGADETG